MFQQAGFLLGVFVFSLLFGTGALVAEPRWLEYENVDTCECENNPLCLMAVKKGNNCRLLWAANRPEADKLRPTMNTIRREAACEAKGQSGFEINGQCLDVSRDEVMKHERMIQLQREKARADCIARGAEGYQDTVTWLGLLTYECVFGSGGDDNGMITCDPGQCYDPSAMFGMQCREAPGCPGGTAVCGSPGC
ncbi:hypothetical protein [Marimonas arenosa]|uniref:Uncharacterized protein n=1 Tax=Marimonas arenosa TaxID=1795305 RepID=A0AAE4B857_9RHOB|nr:hypothetical protein [Marimonas arenosa]MDQ2092256.1 hypothetical protein [Marimonas arenosa]